MQKRWIVKCIPISMRVSKTMADFLFYRFGRAYPLTFSLETVTYHYIKKDMIETLKVHMLSNLVRGK